MIEKRICPKCGNDATGGVLCIKCNIPAIPKKTHAHSKKNKPNPLNNPFGIVVMIVSIIALIVIGLQLVNLFKDPRVLGAKKQHSKKTAKLTKDSQDAINLVKSLPVTFHFRGTTIAKPAYYFIENFNPVTKALTTGMIEPGSYGSSIEWNAESLTQYLYKVTAVNIDHSWVYEFQISITTGEIKALNENAQIVLNYKQH